MAVVANVAQLVEQRFRKARVAGSSPVVGSILHRICDIVGWLFAVLFVLLFFESAMIEWAQYRNYQEFLGR